MTSANSLALGSQGILAMTKGISWCLKGEAKRKYWSFSVKPVLCCKREKLPKAVSVAEVKILPAQSFHNIACNCSETSILETLI